MDYTFQAERPVGQYRRTDKGLLIATLLLWGLGMFTLYIVSPNVGLRLFGNKNYFFTHQLISSVIGLAGLLVFALVPMSAIRKVLPAFTIITLALCILVCIPGIGIEKNGARRWLRLPFLSSFQPSELAKFAVILFMANLFDKQDSMQEDKTISVNCILGLIFFVVSVILQKDFSTAVIILFSGIMMFYFFGAKLAWLIPFAILAVCFGLIVIFARDYRIARLMAWLKPEDFAQTTAYQLMHSKDAIAAGGFWGLGLGSGLSKINSIPEVQTDYIFAGWAESMGLFGVLIYVVLLSYFAIRCVMVGITTRDGFAAYGTLGCGFLIVFQSVVNIAVVCGTLPSTGIPLPFFSFGGSSIIVTLCMCGFMLNASHCEKTLYTNYGSRKSGIKRSNTSESKDEILELAGFYD